MGTMTEETQNAAKEKSIYKIETQPKPDFNPIEQVFEKLKTV
jgi:transposase